MARIYKSSFGGPCEVKMLSKFDFDKAVTKNIHRERVYTLVRVLNHPISPNAVAVFAENYIVGYLEQSVANEVAPDLDSGDVFEIFHHHSTRGDHYDPKFDNQHGDGYFRQLYVTVYNLTKYHAAKGESVSEEDVMNYKTDAVEYSKLGLKSGRAASSATAATPPTSGCFLVGFIFFILFLLLIWAISLAV